MVPDPFAIKSSPKWHPRRLWFTALARLLESQARRRYAELELTVMRPDSLPVVPELEWTDTDVTQEQMQLLAWALDQTEQLGGAAVEVGAYRGVSSSFLAARTRRPYFAVDPYVGYGGSESDLKHLCDRTQHLNRFTHLRQTSGDASRSWAHGPISFLFIDAVHDYVNVRFDIDAWQRHICNDGFIAFHDTDMPNFPGVRRALHEVVPPFELVAHVPNLVVLKPPLRGTAS